MKGPVGRVKLDIRRVWKCPECGTQFKMAGNTTQKLCKCKKEGVWMKIIDEPNQKRVMSSIQKMKDKPPVALNTFPEEEPVQEKEQPKRRKGRNK